MTFCEAAEALLEGKRVKRNWPNDWLEVNGENVIDCRNDDGYDEPFILMKHDLTAVDWEVCE